MTFQRRHYDKALLIFLSIFKYWQENTHPMHGVIQQFLVALHEYPVENFHSVLQARTSVSDTANILLRIQNFARPHVSEFVAFSSVHMYPRKQYKYAILLREHAPSYMILRTRPSSLKLYKVMATCLTGPVDDLITVSFSSMYGLNSSVSLCNKTRLIRKFSLRSSGTTIWSTKPVHQAFVRPGLTQNVRGRDRTHFWQLALKEPY